MSAPVTYYSYYESPVGTLLLAGDGSALTMVSFPEGRSAHQPAADWLRRNGLFDESKRQLAAYFGGELTAFELPVAPAGTEFQRRVWDALKSIPYGETRSYRDIAIQIGKPDAVRAVGAANGQNPLPILVPCHRVIGADGSLTGFSGGIACKQFLLQLEQTHVPFSLQG